MNRRSFLGAAACTCAACGLFTSVAVAESILRPVATGVDVWSGTKRQIDRAMSMSASVTSSLDSLTRNTSNILEGVEKSKEKLRQMRSAMTDLIDKRIRELEEYRSGLFCSGCGKTKSQILSEGDTFPHSGQTIIKATPEQIAAKDRELQAPIDRTQKDIDALDQQMKKLQADAEAGLDQIRHGTLLWVTAKSFAVKANLYGSNEALRFITAQIDDFVEKVRQAEGVLQSASTAEDRQLASVEVKVWERLLQKQRQMKSSLQAEVADLRSRVVARHNEEYSSILGFVQRGRLQGRASAPAAILVMTSTPRDGLGARYLMGKIPAMDGAEERLASVVSFCDDFKNVANSLPGSTANTSESSAVNAESNPASARRLPKLDALP